MDESRGRGPAASRPALSPWRVVLAQVGVGAAVSAVIWLAAGKLAAMSALYGAAVVAIPGALMARAATSRLGALSPLAGTMSMMGWEGLKLALSVVMLALAPRFVPGLVWPAMLATLFICMQTYWFALLWRGRARRPT